MGRNRPPATPATFVTGLFLILVVAALVVFLVAAGVIWWMMWSWGQHQDELDRMELAHSREKAVVTEHQLIEAARDGKLTNHELSQAIEGRAWTVQGGARELRVIANLGVRCYTYTFQMPLGSEDQVTRKETMSCPNATYHPPLASPKGGSEPNQYP